VQLSTIDPAAAGSHLSLVLTALVVMGSPGPATVGAAATATAFGLRRSLPYLAGSIAGTTAVLIAVAAGLASILLTEPRLRVVFLGLAVGYLAYLAYRIATAAPPDAGTTGPSAPGWSSGLVLAVANPKAYAGIGTLVAGSTGDRAGGPLDVVVTTAILTVLIVVLHLGWAVAGASFAAALRRPRISRAVNLVLAAVLLASTAPVIAALLP
jgi:threonine/homoserine/homoserine lactone efflux protein